MPQVVLGACAAILAFAHPASVPVRPTEAESVFSTAVGAVTVTELPMRGCQRPRGRVVLRYERELPVVLEVPESRWCAKPGEPLTLNPAQVIRTVWTGNASADSPVQVAVDLDVDALGGSLPLAHGVLDYRAYPYLTTGKCQAVSQELGPVRVEVTFCA